MPKSFPLSSRTCGLAILLATGLVISAQAENWSPWRGPNQNGVAVGTDYPTHWGEDQNIRWKVKLPGWGTSTPVIWGDQVFVTGEAEQKNALVCVNRAGDQLWQVELGASAGNRNAKASGANPSAVTDGKHVYAYFRNGDLACVDLEGAVVWQVNLQEKHGADRHWWDLGTSPVLSRDFVVVAVMHQGPSYLIALDKETGGEAWKRPRDLGAPAEARDAYTTPLIVKEEGIEMLVVLGADHVTGHRVEDGEEVWRFGGLNPEARGNFRSIASPVAAEGWIVAPYARGGSLTGIRRGGAGDISDSHQAWIAYDVAADVPSPAVYDGRVYLSRDRGEAVCLDLETGKRRWSKRLPRSRYVYSSSPVIAGGKLYITREDGTTFVLSLDDEPELVATNNLRENTYATPVFVDGKIFLRTSDYLFCIGTD